jgi:enamine deaminase RidA (YjgF/YER057c/UK114 family)
MTSSSPSSGNVRAGNNVVTDNCPRYVPFFSSAIKTKDTLYYSGNIGFDPKTNKLINDDIEEQTVNPDTN